MRVAPYAVGHFDIFYNTFKRKNEGLENATHAK